MAKIKAAIEEHRVDPRLLDERGPTEERANKLRPSPINAAVSDKRLTREQGIAAEKLYIHWVRGGLADNCGSMDLDRVFGGGGAGHGLARTEKQLFHRQRFSAAIETVEKDAGARSLWVLKQIVLHEEPFVKVGGVNGYKNRNRAAREALNLLRPALNILCREWGVI